MYLGPQSIDVAEQSAWLTNSSSQDAAFFSSRHERTILPTRTRVCYLANGEPATWAPERYHREQAGAQYSTSNITWSYKCHR